MKHSKTRNHRSSRKIARIVAAALVGGSLASSCNTRVKDSIVGSAQQFVFSLLSPSNPLGFSSFFPTGNGP